MHAPDGDVPPAPFPERVGRYEILIPIASGGMATVYLARTSGLGGFEREVALKLTHSHLRETRDFTASLMDEANLAGRIRHPNVVSVLDVGEDPHGVYLVMEYVEGDTLAGLVRRVEEREQHLPARIAVRIVDDLLSGLHAAHELLDASGQLVGLVHRDVTPHNVLVGVDGVAKLADFGVAKATSRISMTATGTIKGKVAYMAPEQALGHALERTCDVWAAGVVLWELLAGMRLHVGMSDAATLLRIVTEKPPRLRTVRPDLPPELDEIVARALAMDPRKRYPSAEHLARDLEAAAHATCGRAEQREVGEFTNDAVRPIIERRRRKIVEVLELRGRLSRITRSALPAAGGTTPSGVESASLEDGEATRPSWPRVIGPVGPGGTVVLPSSPGSVPPPPRSPSYPPASDGAASTGAHVEPTRTETISVATARARVPKGRRLGLFAGGLALVAVIITVAVVARDRDPSTGAEGASTDPGTLANALAEPGAQAASGADEKGGKLVRPDELPLAGDEERTLTIVAPQPIASVQIGDREITFDEPMVRQTISVTFAERGATLRVTSADGRHGSAEIPRDEDEMRVSLGTGRGGTPQATPVDVPIAPDPNEKGDGLLRNPYKHRR